MENKQDGELLVNRRKKMVRQPVHGCGRLGKTPMAQRYRFHCSDGHHAVFDRVGRWVTDPLLVWIHADQVARSVMSSCGGRLDWTGWIVDVHDQAGRHVCSLDFTDVRMERRAA